CCSVAAICRAHALHAVGASAGKHAGFVGHRAALASADQAVHGAHAMGLSAAIPATVRRDIARSLQFHQRAMKKLRQQALLYIAADRRLQQRYELLRSVPGMGEISAVQTLAEVLLLPADRDVRQWVLTPVWIHGSTVRGLRYASTRASAKRATHICAGPCTCRRWWQIRVEPHLRGFYEHLLARGKSKRQALVAVARKLLHAISGIFRSQLPYDGTRVYLAAAALPGKSS
ncbi:MAG: hypothetical protein JWO71_4172, partial [Candidatus Acidoferrum typicum]|nr:hypothetical protein [Candidatus Acidoferrum typicum]